MPKTNDEKRQGHEPWTDESGAVHVDRALTPQEAAELEQERRRTFLDRRTTRFEPKTVE
jgi:hypothetical protein